MSLLYALTLCVLVVMASADEPRHYDLEQAESLFDQFVQKFNRTYKDDEDRRVHFVAFVESLKKINALNEKSPSATFGINKFADYTKEESEAMFGLRPSKD